MQDDLLRIYEDSFKKNWWLPAISDYTSGETVTYGELARRIAMTHILFERMGVKPGDKVALMGRNSIAWIASFMATITYGAVIVPVLNDFNPQDAQHIVNHSDSVMLFVSEANYEYFEPSRMPKLKAAISLENPLRVLSDGPDDEHAGRLAGILSNLHNDFARRYRRFSADEVRFAVRKPSDVAVINYTSGTTGFSKGVMLTYDNLLGNVAFGLAAGLYNPGERGLSFLPLAHAYGCAFDMLTPLGAGAEITVLGKMPTPAVLLKAMARVRPVLVICVPLILEKIYKKSILPALQKPSTRRMLRVPGLGAVIRRKICRKLVEAFGGNFRQVIVGGAPLNPDVERFLHSIHFPFTVGYGMTECAPLISYTPWRKFIPGSCGRTIPCMESKVESADPGHIPGEICVKGQNVMKGYYKNPEATAAVLDKEGWLHTGDMGTISHDSTIFIKGRSKTMILTATGQNIYPEEIEAKLNNQPFVSESLVVERGGRLVALVYPDYEMMDRAGLSLDKMDRVMEKVRERLNTLVAPYERVDRIQIHPTEFVKTPKRSIKRFLYS